MTNRTWYSGPPPFPGWWNASIARLPCLWRWWDGAQWSFSVSKDASIDRAIEASRQVAPPQSEILWSDYWPENARVARVWPDGRIQK
jgi:hypothetical protein